MDNFCIFLFFPFLIVFFFWILLCRLIMQHNEDHYLYSLNYLHYGEAKQWYGIAGNDAPKFEAAIREAAPELFDEQPDLLFQLVSMLSPAALVRAGVPVSRTTQSAGEFVVTFPAAYHAGFNYGYNVAEAVNVAPADWLPFGARCHENYGAHAKPPVFSHAELLCNIARDEQLPLRHAIWLAPELERVVRGEQRARRALREAGVQFTARSEADTRVRELTCAHCADFCFLTAVQCGRCERHVLCAAHITEEMAAHRCAPATAADATAARDSAEAEGTPADAAARDDAKTGRVPANEAGDGAARAANAVPMQSVPVAEFVALEVVDDAELDALLERAQERASEPRRVAERIAALLESGRGESLAAVRALEKEAAAVLSDLEPIAADEIAKTHGGESPTAVLSRNRLAVSDTASLGAERDRVERALAPLRAAHARFQSAVAESERVHALIATLKKPRAATKTRAAKAGAAAPERPSASEAVLAQRQLPRLLVPAPDDAAEVLGALLKEVARVLRALSEACKLCRALVDKPDADEARAAVESRRGAYTELLGVADKLAVELPQADELRRALEAVRWLDRARALLAADGNTPVGELRAALTAADECGIDKAHPLRAALHRRETQVAEIADRIDALLERGAPYDAAEFEAACADAQRALEVGFVLEKAAELEAIRQRAEAWCVQANVDEMSVADAERLLDAPDAELFVQSSGAPPADSVAVRAMRLADDVRGDLDAAAQWVDDAESVFAPLSSQFDTLVEALGEKTHIARAAANADGENDQWCYCRGGQDGLMTECELCHEWYHNHHVGLDDEDDDGEDEVVFHVSKKQPLQRSQLFVSIDFLLIFLLILLIFC